MPAPNEILAAPVIIRRGKHARWFLGDISPAQQDIWIEDGTLPPVTEFSPRIHGWLYTDLLTHLAKVRDQRQKAGRSAA